MTVAAQAWAGVGRLAEAGESDIFAIMANEVLGSPLDKLLVLAVLTSAAASTQTTILPTARTALSMGAKGALPKMWAKMHPRFQTPTNATLWMGVLSVVFYIGLKVVSENIYYDALAALGLMIAFYYGLTGYACAIYYRHQLLRSAKDLLLIGVLPVLGGVVLTWAFVQSVIDLSDPANSYSGVAWFGVSVAAGDHDRLVHPWPGRDDRLVDPRSDVLPATPRDVPFRHADDSRADPSAGGGSRAGWPLSRDVDALPFLNQSWNRRPLADGGALRSKES